MLAAKGSLPKRPTDAANTGSRRLTARRSWPSVAATMCACTGFWKNRHAFVGREDRGIHAVVRYEALALGMA
jgi:hypothetical protein